MKKYKEYEQDNELLYLICDSNEEANDIIYKKYDPVIDYYAKRCSALVDGKGLDYNDLYQEGLIGLAAAIRNYKENKDIKFSTFAFLCIKRKIYTAVKNANRMKHKILNESFSLDYKEDDEKLGFEDIICSNDTNIEDALVSNEDAKYFNRRVSEELSDIEKMVYELRIGGFGNEEIVSILGKSYKSVESALFRVRIKIKKILDEIN